MCIFKYHEFDQCGHRVIDATEYCQKAKWRAGMTGKLAPCPEVVFKYHLTRATEKPTLLPDGFTPELASTYAWMGAEGMCKSCTRQQKLPESAIIPNNHNSLLSQFSGPTIIAQIISHHNGVPRKSFPTREHPLVHMPTLLSSVFELLGIADQYSVVDQSTSKMLTFPATSFLYTQEIWTSTALVNGIEIDGVPNTYLYANCGLTRIDRIFIDNQIVRGISVENLYRSTYAHRGMPKAKFLDAARNGEVNSARMKAPRFEELHSEDVALHEATASPAAETPKPPGGHPRRASMAAAADASIESPKARSTGIRKSSTPRKTVATPRKVSAVANALSKLPIGDTHPPKIGSAIDPLLLKKSAKKPNLANVQDAFKKYDALKMPPAKAKSVAAANAIKQYSERMLALSAANCEFPIDRKTGNSVIGNTVEVHAPVTAASTKTSSLSSEGNALDDIVCANASLATTPIKTSPGSDIFIQTSPVDGADAAKLKQSPSEPTTPTRLTAKPKPNDKASALIDEFNTPFFDNTYMFGLDAPHFDNSAHIDIPSDNDWSLDCINLPNEATNPLSGLELFDFTSHRDFSQLQLFRNENNSGQVSCGETMFSNDDDFMHDVDLSLPNELGLRYN